MKKFLVSLLVLSMTAGLFGCSQSTPSQTETTAPAETEKQTYEEGDVTSHEHTIAVLTYSRTDEEVLAFKSYLENYIGGCFNVNFLYSDAISSAEEALEFIKLAAENGAQGIMSFNSYNLQEEVALSAEKGMYFMMASGSVNDEDFNAVSGNPYFVGVVGPGSEVEYQAGADMAKYFVEQAYGDEYFILSGGATLSNVMHEERTIGILDELQSAYGVTFDKTSEELAMVTEATLVEAGSLKVCICPGYVGNEKYLTPAIEAYEANPYGNVLSVLAGRTMADTLKGAHIGVIDAFTESNLLSMESGELCYVAGKYGSLIGPSFAAMYNAVTGNVDTFREDGKAFQLEQGFWISTDYEDYLEKYTLAASLEITAYNFDDLYSVCSIYNADASFADLEKLAGEYTFEAVKARRGL